MESSGGWATSTDGHVRSNSTSIILLLAVEIEETFYLDLTLAWLDVLQSISMGLSGDLRRPFHRFDLLIVLNDSRF